MSPDSPPPSASPGEGPPRWRKPLVASGLGLLVLLTGVALLSRDPATEAGGAVPAPKKDSREGTTSRGGAGGTGRGSLEGGEAEAAPRRFESGTCWRDLERFNDQVTVETFRDWAAPLLASRDSVVRNYLKERLTELIGNDAGRAREVLGWARDAPGKEFQVYLSALRDSEAVQQPQVVAQLMAAGLDPKLETGRRAGMLSALDTQKRLEPAALDSLTDFARDPASAEAGWAATRTVARVMKKDFERTGNAAPYLDRLLTIATDSPDEDIRYLAQSTPMHTAPVLDAASTERFSRILTSEGNEDGRDAAAHNLSLSQDKQQVLALFARTFPTEPSVCVRWALFRFSARVAGKDALPVMANMAAIDPRFQEQYRIFEQLYASGVLDFMRVWNSLPNQDPFACMDHHA
ncbi:hypothetical protein OV207_27875 [Corallococcus sp. BB11-1]|uniref:hypothetical protein n=1 Tax=Corallococcus sp. BB11-1 TaxID=2996783 RepID=UPI00226E95DC|nr:hypothetical protein [Corallococcus sp. BB11-1]MCY1035297.1 hypothetical protein [Corallococcus sp. BB11-1]